MNTAIRTIKLLQIKVKLCGDKILARIQKHAPDLGPWDVFWILELIFAFYKVFWILERVLVLGSVLSLPATVVGVFLVM